MRSRVCLMSQKQSTTGKWVGLLQQPKLRLIHLSLQKRLLQNASAALCSRLQPGRRSIMTYQITKRLQAHLTKTERPWRCLSKIRRQSSEALSRCSKLFSVALRERWMSSCLPFGAMQSEKQETKPSLKMWFVRSLVKKPEMLLLEKCLRHGKHLQNICALGSMLPVALYQSEWIGVCLRSMTLCEFVNQHMKNGETSSLRAWI